MFLVHVSCLAYELLYMQVADVDSGSEHTALFSHLQRSVSFFASLLLCFSFSSPPPVAPSSLPSLFSDSPSDSLRLFRFITPTPSNATFTRAEILEQSLPGRICLEDKYIYEILEHCKFQ